MDDLISRQAAIDALYQYPNINWTTLDVMERINEVPSAEPESCEYWDAESNYCALNRPSAQPGRKTGKWLEKEVIPAEEAEEIITEWQSCRCSVCGRYDTRPYLYSFMEPIFCTWCGAEMKKGEDE